MDEPTQPYHEVRTLLADLVASWPWDRPGTAFEKAKIYLDFHCADCGAKLSVNDLAVVLELEMLRLGTVDARKVPYYAPVCVCCYIKRVTPERKPSYQATQSITRVTPGLSADDSETYSSQGDWQTAHLADVREPWQFPSSSPAEGQVRGAGHPKFGDRTRAARHIRCVRWRHLRLQWDSLVVIGLLLAGIAVVLVWVVFRVGIHTLSLHPAMTLTLPNHVGLPQIIRLSRHAGQRPP